jgi:hypothetical protein
MMMKTKSTSDESTNTDGVRLLHEGLSRFQLEITKVQLEARHHQIGIWEESRSQDERFRLHQAEIQRSQAEMQRIQVAMQKAQDKQFRQVMVMLKGKDLKNLAGSGENSCRVGKRHILETTQADSFHNHHAGDQHFQDLMLANPFYTSTLRLDFSCFDGDDSEGWCYRASQFFEYYIITEQQQFTIASFHMEGRALVWFQELRSGNGLTTWSEC